MTIQDCQSACIPSDGSTTLTLANQAQNLFSGYRPNTGWSVSNPTSTAITVCDNGQAASSTTPGAIPVAANSTFTSPTGHLVIGPVSVVGPTTGMPITASWW